MEEFHLRKEIVMRTRKFTSIVFDRKKEVETKGFGKVEIYITLSAKERKYITLKTCTPSLWKKYERSAELAREVQVYTETAELMYKTGEPMTIAVYEAHLGIERVGGKKMKTLYSSTTGFIDFMEECINNEKLGKGTLKHKKVCLRALKEFKRLNTFSSLTPRNIVAFDEWLQEDGTRTTVTINNYHKALKVYTRKAYEKGFIDKPPYDSEMCHFKKGKSKEREPLTEDELVRLRKLKDLPVYEEHARDLFVFCAYTGLAYADCQAFDFHTMTDKIQKTYYIDGQRVKTGSRFYTPILPPAMEVLKKYNYRLPKISNQKLNQYLHLLESRLKLRKKMTSHVARHSFATLILSYDVPVENVARMLGHTDTKTTKIYAKILKTTIERHVDCLIAKLK